MAKRRRTRQTKPQQVVIRSAEMIGWAIGGLEREIAQTRDRLAALTAEAAKLRAKLGLGGAAQSAVESVAPRKRRRMSAAARERISEMMKKRWAERKKNKK